MWACVTSVKHQIGKAGLLLQGYSPYAHTHIKYPSTSTLRPWRLGTAFSADATYFILNREPVLACSLPHRPVHLRNHLYLLEMNLPIRVLRNDAAQLSMQMITRGEHL